MLITKYMGLRLAKLECVTERMEMLSRIIKTAKFAWNQFWRFVYEKKYRYRLMERKGNMRINIIAPNAEAGWIIYKFGISVYEQLKKMGFDASLSEEFDSEADINHYFMPNNVGYSFVSHVNEHTTFMITHVDTQLKVNQIKKLTEAGAIGVCMSLDTHTKLIADGVARNRLCYINPAQDGQLIPKKVVLGFTYMMHDDCRKRDSIVLDVCKEIDKDVFAFFIMGKGWDGIVEQIRKMGFEVDYYSEFDKNIYNEKIGLLDYYCYFGFDEGSMGFLDALAAGIDTIVTPQGYHLDAGIDITYPVCTIDDILEVLMSIEKRQKRFIKFGQLWTWENYTKKHIEIWKYMTRRERLDVLLKNRGLYTDGIFSILVDDLAYDEGINEKINKLKRMIKHDNE